MIAGGQLALFQALRATVLDTREWCHCRDCGVDTIATNEFYIVVAIVWPLEPDGGVLCIRCLEARIGRTLARADFTDSMLNGPKPARSRRLEALSRARGRARRAAAG